MVGLQHEFPDEWTFEGSSELLVGVAGHPTRYLTGHI